MDNIQKKDGFLNEFFYVFPSEWLINIVAKDLYRDLIVTDIGYFPLARYHYRERMEGCETAIILLCLDGQGFLSFNGNDYKLETNQAIIIPPKVSHIYYASQEEPWSVYWVHVKGENLQAYLNATEESPFPIASPVRKDIVKEFQYCFEFLKFPYQMEEYLLICQSVGKIMALLAYACKKSHRCTDKKVDKAIEKSIKFMEDNIKQSLTLDEMAKSAGFSISYFCALFKRSMGCAPMDYFLRTKIHAAARELYFSDSSIKDLSKSYSIQDQYYFSRLFKKIMGVTPKKYKSQIIG